MKRVTIGRGIDCDVVIPDDSDKVSRHHLVISFNFFGKKTLSDTSSNGTYLNGNRMLKGASVPVTRKDEIRLGEEWCFDWSLVKDPYANMRKWALGVLIVVLLVLMGFSGWSIYKNFTKEEPVVEIPTTKEDNPTEWNRDSTDKYAPVETSIKTDKAQKKTVTKRKKQKNRRVNTIEKSMGIKKKNSSDSEQNDMPIVN